LDLSSDVIIAREIIVFRVCSDIATGLLKRLECQPCTEVSAGRSPAVGQIVKHDCMQNTALGRNESPCAEDSFGKDKSLIEKYVEGWENNG